MTTDQPISNPSLAGLAAAMRTDGEGTAYDIARFIEVGVTLMTALDEIEAFSATGDPAVAVIEKAKHHVAVLLAVSEYDVIGLRESDVGVNPPPLAQGGA